MLRPVVTLALVTAFVPAQDDRPSQADLLKAELASPFLQAAPWQIHWDAALAAAKRQHRLIFGYFTTVNH